MGKTPGLVNPQNLQKIFPIFFGKLNSYSFYKNVILSIFKFKKQYYILMMIIFII